MRSFPNEKDTKVAGKRARAFVSTLILEVGRGTSSPIRAGS